MEVVPHGPPSGGTGERLTSTIRMEMPNPVCHQLARDSTTALEALLFIMDDSTRITPSDAASDTAHGQRTVVLTGAAGFVGQHLIRHLVAAGYHVRAVTRHPDTMPAGKDAGAAITVMRHPGFGAAADWTPILSGADAVIHSAGIAHIPLDANHESRQRLRRVNVAGVRELARAAAACGVRQLVFLSSIKAAGEWSSPGQPLRENDPSRPEDCYGFAKRSAERHLARLAQRHPQLRITSLRPPLIYGHGVKANFATLLKLASSGLPLPLGSIRNERSFLYVGNLADAIVTILASPAKAGGLFHLSDGKPVSTPALIRAIAAAAGKPARLLPVPAALLGSAARLAGREGMWQRLAGSLAVSHEAFCQHFDWQPPYTMEQGLAETLKP